MVPWNELLDLTEPPYPRSQPQGWPPPLSAGNHAANQPALQWYDLSDPATVEYVLIEVPTVRRFAGNDMISDHIRDETTILTFRHLLDKNDLGKQIFEVVKVPIHAKVELPFRVIKQQFGLQKTRLREMLKNHCKVNVLAALSSPFIARHSLLCSA